MDSQRSGSLQSAPNEANALLIELGSKFLNVKKAREVIEARIIMEVDKQTYQTDGFRRVAIFRAFDTDANYKEADKIEKECHLAFWHAFGDMQDNGLKLNDEAREILFQVRKSSSTPPKLNWLQNLAKKLFRL
jgi:hypothetical protein